MIWRELPQKLKLYIILLNVLALPIIAKSAWDLFHNRYDSGWYVLAFLTVVTVLAAQVLQSGSSMALMGDAFVMAISMIYGSAPCIGATFCHSLIASIWQPRNEPKRERHLYRIAFNVASTVCCAWTYSNVYRLLNPTYSKNVSNIALPIVALTLTFFLLNSVSTAIAIGLASGKNILRFWEQNYLSLCMEFSISSFFAALMVTLNQFASWMTLVVAPLITFVWWWIKANRLRIIQAETHLKEQEQLYIRTVESLALAVDAKDQTTYGHIRRVKVYALGLAKLCGIKDQNELKAIETGSLLHDIGKIAIDDYILNKPGRLSKKEFEKVKMHAAAGDEILQQVCFPYPVAKYVRYHHERWDGLGYPDGLKAEDIPLGARILAIADAFDAIRFSRPYKLSVSIDEAIEIMRAQAGTVYDPGLIQIFTSHIDELEQTAIKESENAPKLSFRKYSETIDNAFSLITHDSATIPSIPAELVQLAELCSTVSGYLRLKDILPMIARRLQQLVPFTTCVFYIKNSDDRVEAAYVSGSFSKLLQGQTIEMGKSISGWVAAYQKPMVNANPALDFQEIQGDITSLRDSLVIPIVEEEESLGTISLYAEESVCYGQDDVTIVQALASILAALISEEIKNASSISQDIIDPTTGIHRISYLTAIGPQLISSAGSSQTPISLICLEIRNLAQIVRVFGPNLGNLILKSVADCIKPELRETDILARYGQQGFIAFLPGVRTDQALRSAERLKQQIRNAALTPGQGFTLDCQAGISYYPKDGSTVFALLQSAQENMRSEFPRSPASESNVIDFHRA